MRILSGEGRIKGARRLLLVGMSSPQLRERLHPPRGPSAPNPDELVVWLLGVIVMVGVAIGVLSVLGLS